MHKTASQKSLAAERKSSKGAKRSKHRKVGRNKTKCERYRALGRREINKARRIAKDKKRQKVTA